MLFYLRRHEQLELALDRLQQAKVMADHYAPCREVANCYNLLALVIWYLQAPLDQCAEMHLQAMNMGWKPEKLQGVNQSEKFPGALVFEENPWQ